MPPKRTVCYQQREWQPAHFLGKDYHAHFGAVEIERQWLCFSPPMKKRYCQSCYLFGDPSAIQKEWANGVSGNPKNFEVKINHTRKRKRPFMRASHSGDGRRGNALVAFKNRQSRQMRPSDGSICFGPYTLLWHSRGATRSCRIYFKRRLEQRSIWTQLSKPKMCLSHVSQRRKWNNTARHIIFICVQKPSECLCLNRIAPHCTQVRYGAITAWNRYENYVLHTTMFFSKNYLSA